MVGAIGCVSGVVLLLVVYLGLHLMLRTDLWPARAVSPHRLRGGLHPKPERSHECESPNASEEAGGRVSTASMASLVIHVNRQARERAVRKARPFRSDWKLRQARYIRNLRMCDAFVVCGAVGIAQLVRFGHGNHPTLAWTALSGVRYTAVSVTLALLWIGLLALVDSRASGILGHGAEEYRRIVSATFLLFGLIAIVSLLLRMDIARGYLAIAFPLGVAALLVNRWTWRVLARRQYQRGRRQKAMLVVGSPRAAADIANKFSSAPASGYHVVGVCTPEGPTHEAASIRIAGRDIPIVGVEQAVIDAVEHTNADAVVIAPTDHLNPVEIRRLIWELEAQGVDLIVTAGLLDVADRRIHSHPVAGMAMLQVERPHYGRATSWAKRTFDICFALFALLVTAPVMLVAAIAVKVSSPGPVFYTSERIGRNGVSFKMFKFRSMHVGSDQRLAELIDAAGGNPMFFKIKKDPRVVPIGRLLRKFSLDELPQFINVLKGDMSVVGPRPPLRRQVETYDDLTRRRLLVRPGVTGLWQVSGRSDLPIDDAIRLDLSYVENWTMAGDLIIIARTLRAVIIGDGAY